MSQVTRTASKAKFQTGDTPTENDFIDLHDSAKWYDENAITTENTPASLPSTPATGVTPFALKRGAVALAWVNPLGETFEVQPSFGFRHVQIVSGLPSSSTPSYFNIQSGSFTLSGQTARTPALGSILAQSVRVGFVTAGTAGATASMLSGAFYWRGNGTGQGGFDVIIKFGLPTTPAGVIFFAGMSNSTFATATTEPSAKISIFGFAKDSGDTNIQFMRNDGSGTATKVDTGIAVSNTNVYMARMYCKPNDTNMYAALYDYANNVIYDSGAISTDLPTTSTDLRWYTYISNNATASAAAIDLLQATTTTQH